MDCSEIFYRNRILRTYFQGRNWDNNGEFILKRKLVLNSKQLLQGYPYLIEDEWEVEPGRTDSGRGDLVFTDACCNFAVVEVKCIDLESTGHNASTKRTKKRRKVEEQAIKYAEKYREIASYYIKNLEPQVEAFIFTNDSSQPQSILLEQFTSQLFL